VFRYPDPRDPYTGGAHFAQSQPATHSLEDRREREAELCRRSGRQRKLRELSPMAPPRTVPHGSPMARAPRAPDDCPPRWQFRANAARLNGCVVTPSETVEVVSLIPMTPVQEADYC